MMSFQSMVCDESLYSSVMKQTGTFPLMLRAQFLLDARGAGRQNTVLLSLWHLAI